MKAVGFFSMLEVVEAWPLAGSLEMWRWVEILASSWWSVMPGPVDLGISRYWTPELGDIIHYLRDGGRVILRLPTSGSVMLTVLMEDSLLVQNSWSGFSRETCFNSAFTLDLCSLYTVTGCLKIEAVCLMGATKLYSEWPPE